MTIASIERNLREKFKYLAEKIPSTHIETIENASLVDTKLPSDTFNTVFGGDVSLALARKIFAHYKENNLPMSWWIGPSSDPILASTVLKQSGFTKDETAIGMSCILQIIPTLPPLDTLDIRVCQTISDFEDFANVLSSVFNPIDTQIIPFYRKTASLPPYDRENMIFFVGYEKEKPVASSCLFLTEAAGIYDIATRPEKRNLGYGSALLYQSLLEAKKRNYQEAILQASAEGINLYKRFGFKEVCEFSIWSNKESLPKNA